MVLKKQNSDDYLSVESKTLLATQSADDPSTLHWSQGGPRGIPETLCRSVDRLELLESSEMKRLEERKTKEANGDDERLALSMDTQRLLPFQTVPDLSGGSAEGDGLNEEWTMEKERSVTRSCHHHLLMADQENDDEPRVCQLCRKKEERLKALRRAIGDDDHGPESSSGSSSGLTIMVKSAEAQSTSTESPSSPAGSDRGNFDPSWSLPFRPVQDNRYHGHSNGQHRLAPPSASHTPGGHSVDGHSGQSSPRNNSSGQQQALIQKLQGALSKISPKVFKSTKSERPFSAASNQDQKILAIMLAKKEDEERQRNLRELSHRQWEEEMKNARETTASSSRGSSFRRRRHTADPGNLRKKDKSVEDVNLVDGGRSGTQTPCSAHGNSYPASIVDDRDGGGSENLDKGRRTSKSCFDPRQQQKSREKQIQAMERKKSVEQRLEQQRREMEEHQLQLKKKQEQDLERANSVRMSREQKQTLRAKLKNLEAQQKQERISQMKRKSMVDLSQKQEEIQSRLSKAELNAQKLKQEEARRKRDDLERRIEQSRLRQEQIEAEQSKWQEEVLKYQKWKDYQADGLAKENLAKKREAACVERIQREKLQRENMKRLLNQEEHWLNDVEAAIAMKDARIRTVQKEKEEQIQKSRAMASAYQRMREELKTHYSMNDLDQVTQKVALENRLAFRTGAPYHPSGRLQSPPTLNSSAMNLNGEGV